MKYWVERKLAAWVCVPKWLAANWSPEAAALRRLKETEEVLGYLGATGLPSSSPLYWYYRSISDIVRVWKVPRK